MAQQNTPPWAKRIENKIDQLLLQEKPIKTIDKCRYHKKYGVDTKKKCNPPCDRSFVRFIAVTKSISTRCWIVLDTI